MLLLNIYLVDVLFNLEDASTKEQLVLASRRETALAMGAALVVPMILVHLAGFIKAGVETRLITSERSGWMWWDGCGSSCCAACSGNTSITAPHSYFIFHLISWHEVKSRGPPWRQRTCRRASPGGPPRRRRLIAASWI